MPPSGSFNSKSPTIKRILREASELSSSPSPDYTATPLDDNLFEWHFTLRGPPGDTSTLDSAGESPYARGIYHGRIVLPPTYPLRPPSFRFLTPSGRFETNREICLSISGHHEETWQPAWGLRTALVALRTFMETDAKGQVGGLECSDAARRRMASESQAWTCSSCGKSNADILKECEEAAKATDAKADEAVPPELKMGWKDEMGPDRRASEDGGEESAQLAEGFVQTAPPVMLEEPSAVVAPAYPAPRPAQGVPQPTATIPLPPAQQAPLAPRLVPRQSNEGVPAWVDKAIAGIAACLLIMILKLFLGF
ncbi:MAG: hypothetical protein M1818_006829 [Claussenomyces sp. TS43310]|nr:MAG: hypothetical protein M1818_006829 [Claussenomyces sp. TS43310]